MNEGTGVGQFHIHSGNTYTAGIVGTTGTNWEVKNVTFLFSQPHRWYTSTFYVDSDIRNKEWNNENLKCSKLIAESMCIWKEEIDVVCGKFKHIYSFNKNVRIDPIAFSHIRMNALSNAVAFGLPEIKDKHIRATAMNLFIQAGL